MTKARRAQVLETLTKARDLIQDRERWTQSAMARDSDGNPTYVHSESAVCWCDFGAIDFVTNSDTELSLAAMLVLFDAITEENPEYREFGHTPTRVVVSFNDSHSHADVLRITDRAIELVSGAPE